MFLNGDANYVAIFTFRKFIKLHTCMSYFIKKGRKGRRRKEGREEGLSCGRGEGRRRSTVRSCETGWEGKQRGNGEKLADYFPRQMVTAH